MASPSKRARVSGGAGEDALIGTADSASLYNVTLSPGWTAEDSKVLELALAKFGVGRWAKITEAGVLPGKSVAQLNLQTQRLLGQQSTREFMGLHLFCSRVGLKNAQLLDAPRKNGCIINDGDTISLDESRRRKALNKQLYGLSDAQVAAIVLPRPPLASTPAADAAAAADAADADANAADADDDDDKEAIAAAERRARVILATQTARAAAKPMPVRDWNRATTLDPALGNTAAAVADPPPPAETHAQ